MAFLVSSNYLKIFAASRLCDLALNKYSLLKTQVKRQKREAKNPRISLLFLFLEN